MPTCCSFGFRAAWSLQHRTAGDLLWLRALTDLQWLYSQSSYANAFMCNELDDMIAGTKQVVMNVGANDKHLKQKLHHKGVTQRGVHRWGYTGGYTPEMT